MLQSVGNHRHKLTWLSENLVEHIWHRNNCSWICNTNACIYIYIYMHMAGRQHESTRANRWRKPCWSLERDVFDRRPLATARCYTFIGFKNRTGLLHAALSTSSTANSVLGPPFLTRLRGPLVWFLLLAPQAGHAILSDTLDLIDFRRRFFGLWDFLITIFPRRFGRLDILVLIFPGLAKQILQARRRFRWWQVPRPRQCTHHSRTTPAWILRTRNR